MALVRKHLPHYTYSDYEQWEGRWELISGIPYAMTPSPNIRHQILNAHLSKLFLDALEECSGCSVATQLDWKVAQDSVLCPDISVFCGEAAGKFLSKPPEIVVEIFSPSTRHKDKTLKFEIYQEQGVKYYLMVDPDKNELQLYRLEKGKYQDEQLSEQGFQFEINGCDFKVQIGSLFK